MAEIEEKVNDIENLLARFIGHTNVTINRLTHEVISVVKNVDI